MLHFFGLAFSIFCIVTRFAPLFPVPPSKPKTFHNLKTQGYARSTRKSLYPTGAPVAAGLRQTNSFFPLYLGASPASQDTLKRRVIVWLLNLLGNST